ncbi:hypothetical protein J4H86_19000 [Spiractinospora alimapuensis]|uniref:hypothetical protein n=1 Tax=Spiractinospora alimapuensis TaxID=2820884 RepID=UPI001F26A7CE|nr:hypothetical protein [Spiractinospora alimapuensis]QVQ50930.1 hypothetical protein J4H86_19000 [Spiractinospora alimapuensis]
MSGAGDAFRFVVDESSLDFRGFDDAELTWHLDRLSQTLQTLRTEATVAVFSLIFDTQCLDGTELGNFLFSRESDRISPDVRRLLGIQLDRCPSWDEGFAVNTPTEVQIADVPIDPAWSVGYALYNTTIGYNTGCVVFAARHYDWLSVSGDDHVGEVCFLTDTDGLPVFWQGLFRREDIQEAEFLDHATRAFPNLICAPGLRFGAFDGSYREMRDWTVHVLSVLDAHFAEALTSCNGQAHQVQARLGSKGVTVSQESPSTRSKPKVIAQRDVKYGGEVYRCEWHAKKEGHRNRIHFALPDSKLGDRILIGIFTDHLDT